MHALFCGMEGVVDMQKLAFIFFCLNAHSVNTVGSLSLFQWNLNLPPLDMIMNQLWEVICREIFITA
jgi:hypothetical protein